MAIKVKTAAVGNAPATGAMKTPAPTRQAPPDAVMEVRHPSAQSYGENGPKNNQSRTNPGEVMESDLARNLRQSVDDDGVLDRIIRGDKPSKGNIADLDLQSPQTRDVSSESYPVAHGMVRQQQDYSSIGRTGLPNKQSESPKDDSAERRTARLPSER